MINGKRVLALIPARGGSKGLPGKNIRMICGQPLIAWTIQRALASSVVDEVVVSTDSEEIAQVSQSFGASVPIMRPPSLATDEATTFSVVEHMIDFYREDGKGDFDYLVLLEPTSPLREENDIEQMFKLLDAKSAQFDSIISVGEVAEHPSIVKRECGERLKPFCDQLEQSTRRQDNVPALFPYGVAYIVKVDCLLQEKTFYTERSTFYKILRYQNYEIDDIYDFICVENVMKYEWKLAC